MGIPFREWDNLNGSFLFTKKASKSIKIPAIEVSSGLFVKMLSISDDELSVNLVGLVISETILIRAVYKQVGTIMRFVFEKINIIVASNKIFMFGVTYIIN